MNIYFSGIGGVGIGPLAEIAFDAGYHVFGSDLNDSPIVSELRQKGIEVQVGEQDGAFLKEKYDQGGIDMFVYTSALTDDHPELVLARQLGIKTAKRDELLAKIIEDKNLKLIGVAGTHGKTTTTAMLVWTFMKLGIPASYSIGTTINFGPSGKFEEGSEYFIYECDEFDRNFLHFKPYLALIASIDYDHPDTYPTEQDYLDAFRKFAEQSQNVVCWKGQHGEIFEGLRNVGLLDEEVDVDASINLVGQVYRKNASLIKSGLLLIGFTSDVADILSSYPGSNRRFEKLGDNIYSDYAHHPTEIAATLQIAKEKSDRVVVIYQPHQNVRQHLIKDQYTNQFEEAEEVYWLPTYLSRENRGLEILGFEQLTNKLTNKDKVFPAEFNDELWNKIKHAAEDGKLVLVLGAGEIDSWVRKRLKD